VPPAEVITKIEICWFIEHFFRRHDGDSEGYWSRTWTGKRHGPEDAEEHEILAHQALDRGWTPQSPSRLTREERCVTERKVVVPAMWEQQ